MISTIAENLGYDEFGNAPHLLAECDRVALEEGRFTRVAGEADCQVCGCKYRHHPEVQGATYLRRACDGLVKL